MTYLNQAFEVHSLEQAKSVVLSPDSAQPNKFEIETNFLIDAVEQLTNIDSHSRVLDYGCGMGRISRELIKRFQCCVIGLDISSTMLYHARQYLIDCDRCKFTPTQNYTEPNSIDLVLAVLCLQHVQYPQQEIANIARVLRPNGQLILVNSRNRFVPLGVDRDNFVVWYDDGFDVHNEIELHLEKIKSIPYIDHNYDVVVYQKSQSR